MSRAQGRRRSVGALDVAPHQGGERTSPEESGKKGWFRRNGGGHNGNDASSGTLIVVGAVCCSNTNAKFMAIHIHTHDMLSILSYQTQTIRSCSLYSYDCICLGPYPLPPSSLIHERVTTMTVSLVDDGSRSGASFTPSLAASSITSNGSGTARRRGSYIDPSQLTIGTSPGTAMPMVSVPGGSVVSAGGMVPAGMVPAGNGIAQAPNGMMYVAATPEMLNGGPAMGGAPGQAPVMMMMMPAAGAGQPAQARPDPPKYTKLEKDRRLQERLREQDRILKERLEEESRNKKNLEDKVVEMQQQLQQVQDMQQQQQRRGRRRSVAPPPDMFPDSHSHEHEYTEGLNRHRDVQDNEPRHRPNRRESRRVEGGAMRRRKSRDTFDEDMQLALKLSEMDVYSEGEDQDSRGHESDRRRRNNDRSGGGGGARNGGGPQRRRTSQLADPPATSRPDHPQPKTRSRRRSVTHVDEEEVMRMHESKYHEPSTRSARSEPGRMGSGPGERRSGRRGSVQRGVPRQRSEGRLNGLHEDDAPHFQSRRNEGQHPLPVIHVDRPLQEERLNDGPGHQQQKPRNMGSESYDDHDIDDEIALFHFRRKENDGKLVAESTLKARATERMSELVKRLQQQARESGSGVLTFCKREADGLRTKKRRVVFVMKHVQGVRIPKEEFGEMKAKALLFMTDVRPVVIDIQTERVPEQGPVDGRNEDEGVAIEIF